MDRENASENHLDETFRALADRQRRIVLACLLTSDGPRTIEELANEIAVREREAQRRSTNGVERLRIELYHKQLPLLAESGLVRYDGDRDRVEATARVDEIEPFLPTD